MPNAAPKPCNHPGCGKLVHNASYCEQHQKAKRKQSDDRRGSSTARGYGYKWQQASKAFLKAHPTCNCKQCVDSGYPLASNVVDHIIPHRLEDAKKSGDPARIAAAQKLMWDRKNWQAMNEDCHNKKTAKEDGGFGRGRGHQKSTTFGL